RPGYWNDPDMLVVGTQLAEFLGTHPGTVPSAVLKALPLTLQQWIAGRAGIKQVTSLLALTPEQIAALRDPQSSLTLKETAHTLLAVGHAGRAAHRRERCARH